MRADRCISCRMDHLRITLVIARLLNRARALGYRLEKERRATTTNLLFFVMTEQEEKAHYCAECGKKLKAFNLTSYSKYLCPDCDELEHECFTGEGH